MSRAPRRIASRTIASYPHLALHEHDLRYDDADEPFNVQTLTLKDWCVSAAVTASGQWVLVEQHRHGVDGPTLEPAGGIVDPGEAIADAARRELLEETGYAGGRVEPLGWVHPNPALSSNRAHLFLFEGVHREGDPQHASDERTRVVLLPGTDLERALSDGRITHALGVLALTRALGTLGPTGKRD
jgi:8-oxo-dGTP pyrophosphatase MutT (NUDIX family)